MNESVTMTPDEWRDLNTLCRKVLAEAPPELRDHDLYNAVSLTGAFAASVIDHMEGN